MFNKLIFYILFLLINSSLEYYGLQLEQYGSSTVTDRSVLFLSLNNFKSKDTLYFEVSFYSTYNYSSISLGFWENNNYNYNSYQNFNNMISQLYSTKGNTYTFYFSYTLKENKDYLLILTPIRANGITYFTLKHVKELSYNAKKGNIVGGIICIVIDTIIIIALNIILCRCKRKNEESLRKLVESTNTNQPQYSNQPAFTQPQPLYDQSPTPVN